MRMKTIKMKKYNYKNHWNKHRKRGIAYWITFSKDIFSLPISCKTTITALIKRERRQESGRSWLPAMQRTFVCSVESFLITRARKYPQIGIIKACIWSTRLHRTEQSSLSCFLKKAILKLYNLLDLSPKLNCGLLHCKIFVNWTTELQNSELIQSFCSLKEKSKWNVQYVYM